ncbi:MAG TPA: hypothetical protein VF549_14810 [Solirubrobacteraceae bacterium]
MRRGAFASAFVAAALAGCGGSDADAPRAVPDHEVPQRPVATGPGLVEPAPEWVREFCAEVARRSDLACPRVVPAGFAALDLPQERPAARGFTLRGAGGWTISGRARLDAPALSKARVTGGSLRWGHYAIRGPGSPRQIRAVARGMTRG